uniref:Uncharacterized protein n=1 Tax=Tetradesmus obliquus TaxID=3088 RepID=A0A383WJE1_TETOB|eukprot:jgi/Sobl393_1/2474/SZX76856.1
MFGVDLVFAELKGPLLAALKHAAIATAGQLQQQVDGSAQQAAQLQQQLLQLQEACQTRLAEADADLCSSKRECSELKVALAASKEECSSLLCKLQQKQRELAELNAELNSKQDELDRVQDELQDAKCRGRELLTYQGMSSAGADLGTLNQAFKQLSDATAALVGVLASHSVPVMAPFVVDLDGIMLQAGSKLQQLELYGRMHAVLGEVASHVFDTFCTDHLISSSIFDSSPDEDTLLLHLMLEK